MPEKVRMPLGTLSPAPLPLVYTVRDVMPLLRLSRNSVHKLLQSGELRSVRFGRKWLIPAEALHAFLSEGTGESEQ